MGERRMVDPCSPVDPYVPGQRAPLLFLPVLLLDRHVPQPRLIPIAEHGSLQKRPSVDELARLVADCLLQQVVELLFGGEVGHVPQGPNYLFKLALGHFGHVVVGTGIGIGVQNELNLPCKIKLIYAPDAIKVNRIQPPPIIRLIVLPLLLGQGHQRAYLEHVVADCILNAI